MMSSSSSLSFFVVHLVSVLTTPHDNVFSIHAFTSTTNTITTTTTSSRRYWCINNSVPTFTSIVLFQKDNNRYDESISNNENENENENEKWDSNVDYDKEWTGSSSSTPVNNEKGSRIPDPGTSWDTSSNLLSSDLSFGINDGTTPEFLGIDLSLEPLSAAESERLRKDARKIIEDAIDDGVNDIETLKQKMKRDLDTSRRAMNLASDLEAKRKSDMLMKKIDTMTEQFLKSSEKSRTSTKMAAAANRAMEGTGTSNAKALEVGTWGVLLDGTTVLADDDININTEIEDGGNANALLGSVRNAVRKSASLAATTTSDDIDSDSRANGNRISIIADVQNDKVAKQIVPALIEEFSRESEEDNIPGLKIDVLSPTTVANVPLGGNDAACVIVFCTSVNSGPDTLKKILDRMLRKTLASGGGKIGEPPTQLIGISTLGTERFENFPYNLQNFLGGKLAKRRSIEEVIINTVRDRVTEPSLDYTIIKLKEEDEFAAGLSSTGDEDNNGKSRNSDNGLSIIFPGDSNDDATTIETAVEVIVQATAYQPSARNSTLSISGALPSSSLLLYDKYEENDFQSKNRDREDFWRDIFTCLDGPELWRTTIYDTESSSSAERIEIEDYYDGLVEYVQEWGQLLAESGKGLTTPVRAVVDELDPTSTITPATSRTILYQEGVRLLFLPTNTGAKYLNREEEAHREKNRQVGGSTTKSSSPTAKTKTTRISKEGGIDVVVEIVRKMDHKRNEKFYNKYEQQQVLRVRARRTNYAEDTIVKELSETTILKRLQDALKVWKTDQNLP